MLGIKLFYFHFQREKKSKIKSFKKFHIQKVKITPKSTLKNNHQKTFLILFKQIPKIACSHMSPKPFSYKELRYFRINLLCRISKGSQILKQKLIQMCFRIWYFLDVRILYQRDNKNPFGFDCKGNIKRMFAEIFVSNGCVSFYAFC